MKEKSGTVWSKRINTSPTCSMLSTDLLKLLLKFLPDTTVLPPRLVVPALPPNPVLLALPPKLPTLREVSLLCNPRRSPSQPRGSCLLKTTLKDVFGKRTKKTIRKFHLVCTKKLIIIFCNVSKSTDKKRPPSPLFSSPRRRARQRLGVTSREISTVSSVKSYKCLRHDFDFKKEWTR